MKLKLNIEKFSDAESIDNGKPLTLSKSLDIPRSIKNLEFFAILRKIESHTFHQMTSKVILLNNHWG